MGLTFIRLFKAVSEMDGGVALWARCGLGTSYWVLGVMMT